VFACLNILSLVLCGCSRQSEQSKAADQIVRDFVAAGNMHDVERQVSLFTDDCIYEDVALGKTTHGKDELHAFSKEFFAGAPDLKEELKSVIVSGNRVAIEWIMSGTHTGDWPDLPANGKSFSMRGVSLMELRDGKIQRNTDYYDSASWMRQLGVEPQAAASDPFAGTWKLNLVKSKVTDPSVMPKSEIFKIDAIANGIKSTFDGVDADGTAFHAEGSAKYDGKDYPLAGNATEVNTVMLKKIDATTVEWVFKNAGKEVERWRATLSKDGKTNTSTGKGTNPQGQEYKATWIYDKQ
jgi:steroid delta-isomerase-like uncharacterized protein